MLINKYIKKSIGGSRTMLLVYKIHFIGECQYIGTIYYFTVFIQFGMNLSIGSLIFKTS